MIFNHQLTIENEKMYKQNIKTLNQTKNSLRFYYENYAFYSTEDGKLHPCYYPHSAYRFLKFGDIALATDFVEGGISSIPAAVMEGVFHMQSVNKMLANEDFSILSCELVNSEQKEYIDYVIYIKKANVYIKVFNIDDVKAINNFSIKSMLDLNLPENNILSPYEIMIMNSGELILKARSVK